MHRPWGSSSALVVFQPDPLDIICEVKIKVACGTKSRRALPSQKFGLAEVVCQCVTACVAADAIDAIVMQVEVAGHVCGRVAHRRDCSLAPGLFPQLAAVLFDLRHSNDGNDLRHSTDGK